MALTSQRLIKVFQHCTSEVRESSKLAHLLSDESPTTFRQATPLSALSSINYSAVVTELLESMATRYSIDTIRENIHQVPSAPLSIDNFI